MRLKEQHGSSSRLRQLRGEPALIRLSTLPIHVTTLRILNLNVRQVSLSHLLLQFVLVQYSFEVVLRILLGIAPVDRHCVRLSLLVDADWVPGIALGLDNADTFCALPVVVHHVRSLLICWILRRLLNRLSWWTVDFPMQLISNVVVKLLVAYSACDRRHRNWLIWHFTSALLINNDYNSQFIWID